MTTVLNPPITRSLPRRLRDDEVTELSSITVDLPHLRSSLPIDLDDALLRLEAAVWELARRHDVRVCPNCTLLDVIDGLAAKGWSSGPARDALRAIVMLRAGGAIASDEPRVALALSRLIGYLELRSRFG